MLAFIVVIIGILVTVPVVAAAIVLAWHGLRGTNPGPAGPLLLQLCALVLSCLVAGSRRGR